MNLKYYLRGLGVGVIVTALIMGIAASGNKETLSDSEVIERAKALGMTEETTLIEDAVSDETPDSSTGETSEPTAAVPDVTSEPTAVPTATPDAASEPTAVPTATPDAEPQATVEAAATSQPTESPSATSKPVEGSAQDSEVVVIQINSGDGSYSVCMQLEEAGLVESASEFDRYLYDNGYDKRVNVGVFEIPKGAGPEQIAKILARLE